jgi:hypothetical protein
VPANPGLPRGRVFAHAAAGHAAQLQEFGPDTESREEFTWAASAVNIAVDFAPTEAVQSYRIGKIAPCPCAAD